MIHDRFRRLLAGAALAAAMAVTGAGLPGDAQAQKHGGTLIIPHIDSPPSPSIQEEATASVVVPFMTLYNNLVIFNQHEQQNRMDNIVPELATGWKWSDDGKKLTFTLREGVKWHDGKPFTSADVKYTWDMVSGLTPGKIRKSPRQAWFTNLKEVTVNGPYEVTFHLGRPQPSFLSLLAAGWSPVYPAHISSGQMRTKPIGTGPFRFVEYKMNESMKVERNPDYWKKGLPYLDAIEWRIVPNRATRMLGLAAGKFDMSYPTDVSVPLLRDLKNQAPNIQCFLRRTNVSTNLIINRDVAPFDNADVRRALALTIDRAAFNDILNEGQGGIGGAMLPAPSGVWGMPDDFQKTLLGYDPDVKKNREEARAIMRKLGYGPDKRLKTKVFTRDIPTFRPGPDHGRPPEGDLHRRRGRDRRHAAILQPRLQEGLRCRHQPDRILAGRPRPELLRELRLRQPAQLHELLQQGAGGRVRGPVAGAGPREAQEDGVGHREEAGRGRCPSDHLPQHRRRLLAAACEERQHHDQQHLQRLALGRPVDGQVIHPPPLA